MDKYKNLIKIVMVISIFLLSACLFTNVISAATVNVNAADSDGIKGTIEKSNTGDTIVLATGTYKGDNNRGINIEKSLTIRGNGPTSSVIIDGQKNSKIFEVNYGTSVTFTNITFRNGLYSAVYGGSSSKMTFINCAFTNNDRTAISNSGTLKVSNCVFTNNEGDYGGAISNSYGTSTVSNCVFTNNKASSRGAAIYSQGGTLKVSNCKFTGNNAAGLIAEGGAILSTGGSNSKVSNCVFTKNKAAGDGGAISNYGILTVSKCSFTNNVAVHGGGAIYNVDKLTVSNSVFKGNKAGNGGAVYNRDTINVCTISGSTFTKNSATRNGFAIYNDAYMESSGKFVWGVIVSNNNIIKDHSGSAIHNLGTITVKGTTMSANTGGNIVGDGTVNGKITTVKPAKANIKLAKSTTSKASIVKGKKVFTKNYIYKNYGKATGSKKFTITIDKKFTLTGKITKTKNIAFSYNKKTKKIAVNVKNLAKSKTASIKFQVF